MGLVHSALTLTQQKLVLAAVLSVSLDCLAFLSLWRCSRWALWLFSMYYAACLAGFLLLAFRYQPVFILKNTLVLLSSGLFLFACVVTLLSDNQGRGKVVRNGDRGGAER